MLLSVRLGLRRLFATKKSDDGLIHKEGRMFYDIPTYYTSSKFHYKINEEVPEDAVDFSLANTSIKTYEDTPDFNKIPKLHHGLNKLLDGKIYEGDMGFGKIPNIEPKVIEQMSDYKPPSQDKTLL